MIIQAKAIEFSYNINQIFCDVNFIINEGDKIGLVGDNGSGKSTLAKCLTGELEPSGMLTFAPNLKISYLKQQITTSETRTVMEVSLEKYEDIIAMSSEMRRLEDAMSECAGDELMLEGLLAQYQNIKDRFEDANGYGYMSEIKGYLAMVGMREAFYDKSVRLLSGGEKARLDLALVFMEKPDLLILDEPTNHMDVEMIGYLEKFLKEYRGTVLFISHDRLLLQNVATRIFDMQNGSLKVYDMGYDAYRRVMKNEREEQMRHYENYKAEVERQKEIIRRFRSYATERYYRLAKSREKLLARIETETPPAKSEELRFKFKEPLRTGDDVLTVMELSKSFPDKKLFDCLSFVIKRCDRLGIIGTNGSGKTTLLKIIQGMESHGGEYLWGTGVKLGYFNQELQVNNEENTLIDEISDEYPKMNIHEIRSLLGSFLFHGEDVFKEMKDLSGGERARIALLKLILSGTNVLLLDEPTNHLDLNSKEVLEGALEAFKGTIIFISHDRFFIRRLANRILDMTPGECKVYDGSYDYFMSKKNETCSAETEEVNRTEQKKQNKRSREEIRKRQAVNNKIRTLEGQIQDIEADIRRIDELLSDSGVYDDHEKVLSLAKERDGQTAMLETLYDGWTSLNEEI